MAEPPLNEVRRNVGLKSVHPEPMSQALRHCGRANDSDRRHNDLDVAPGGRAAPAPQAQPRKLRIPLRDPQREHAIKLA